MVCQACHRVSPGFLCRACIGELRPAPDRILTGGVRLIAAFEHVGPARVLSHHLKYRALVEYASLVADLLACRIPPIPLVPVPRARSRQVRYGIDPAAEIADAIGARTRAPVLHALRHPLHSKRRAGGDHRSPARGFRMRYPVAGPVAVVDDVVTTGRTIQSVIEEIGYRNVVLVVSANAANQVSSYPVRAPIIPL